MRMSDLFYTACQPDDEPISEDFLCNELIIPESFEEALYYAEQLIWLYLHKQAELVEGDNITLTDNGDGTVTISAVGGDIKGIDRIDSVVGDTQTTVTIYYTDGTHQSFIVKAGPQGEQGVAGQDGVSIVSVTFKETVTQWINTTKDVYTAQGHTGETVQISVPRYSVFTITYSNGTTSEIQVFAGCTIYPYSIVEDYTVTPATHKIYIRNYKPVTNTSSAITDFTITDGAQGAQGPAGQDGADGADGADGEDGSRFWTTTVAPTTPDYTFTISDLSGVSGETPKVGDYILLSDSDGSHLYFISTVSTTTVLATFVCDLGSAGGGLPSGGAEEESLEKVSTTEGDVAWRRYPVSAIASLTYSLRTGGNYYSPITAQRYLASISDVKIGGCVIELMRCWGRNRSTMTSMSTYGTDRINMFGKFSVASDFSLPTSVLGSRTFGFSMNQSISDYFIGLLTDYPRYGGIGRQTTITIKLKNITTGKSYVMVCPCIFDNSISNITNVEVYFTYMITDYDTSFTPVTTMPAGVYWFETY